MYKYFVLQFNFFLVVCIYGINCIILHTKQGSLKGETLHSRDGRTFYAFYTIPYAEPPIGDLRFKDPVAAKSWDGVRDATVLPPACISQEYGQVNGQEDCLYLNVYTPKIKNDGVLLPIMVFIYGGAFMYGNALPHRYGAHYFMDEDVVLITFHYRLGPLGFLSTEDEVIPGNYGLKDEVAVLKWIQKYADAYGGDKNRVTLFGGSSGGVSASLALISPLAEGLFHRVISQSGSPLGVSQPGVAKQNAWKFGSLVGCDNEAVKTSEDLLACLKKIPAEELVKNYEKLRVWGPVVENEKVSGAFLVDEPRKLLPRKTHIPWIQGINSADGAMTAIFTYRNSKYSVIDELDENYKKYFPLILGYGRRIHNAEHLDYLTESLKNYYFGDKSIRENIQGFSKMVTGLLFLSPLRTAVRLYKGPQYVYYYDHRNKESFASTYGKVDEEMGVIHGDELISMFNWSSVITPVTEGVDLAVSKKILRLWTNFADKGDPNDDHEQLWRPIDSPNINYLHIKDGTFEMKNELLKSEADFLDSILNNLNY